ncbi:ead/Ea22-like family protein [Klebsiella pneumoniae]
MTTDITGLAQSLKAAAENAVGAHERLAAYPYGEIIDISQHEGEQIDIDITDLNEFNKEANPVNILALVEALEKAQQRIDSQREYYDGVIADGGKRIAELESRTVKLPKPHAHLIWIQAGHAPDDYWDDVEVSHSEKDRCCDGSERYPVYARWEIEEMLAAAGIKVEAE